ncbi:putative glycosyltransferase family 31 protein [Neofusicoccum parvum UCRNP2]|uniref:N-acetylgalactosaminide beta-1,3-galactosyltransferase n=1 Tax=Botryosphaeria parva (strain UCR-NP2) TaxID=1287680 RepID=R1EEK2_BOTPV|nr:putative glycosyltransferase family 31 protein [Neofusicoccum parvum UCRNP2]
MILWDNGYVELNLQQSGEPQLETYADHQKHEGQTKAEASTSRATVVAAVEATTVADYAIKNPVDKDNIITEAFSDEAAAAVKEHGNALGTLDPNDVLIMFKTGATKMWYRAPMHLATTLANKTLTPHVVFYSDIEEQLGEHAVIDTLANVSTSLKESPDFALWRGVRQAYGEDNLYLDGEGQEAIYVPGGWRIDKYKFLPMVQHAALNYPGKKWYVFLEDDNYFFWESLYAWLATFDADQPVFVGGPAARLGEDFAHGGSGLALSRGAMRKSFAADPKLASNWEHYAAEYGCGDHILSHVLAAKGVTRWRGFDDTEYYPMHALPLWQMGFGAWDWCSPLFNVHKAHQSDLSKLHVWEKKWKAMKGGSVRYRDVFVDLILPKLVEERDEWDNYASERHFTSFDEEDAGTKLSDAEKKKQPWFSKDACKQACHDWQQCLQWRYADDHCYLDHMAKQGRRIEAGIRMRSGWMMGRIRKLQEKKCGSLPWWQ